MEIEISINASKSQFVVIHYFSKCCQDICFVLFDKSVSRSDIWYGNVVGLFFEKHTHLNKYFSFLEILSDESLCVLLRPFALLILIVDYSLAHRMHMAATMIRESERGGKLATPPLRIFFDVQKIFKYAMRNIRQLGAVSCKEKIANSFPFASSSSYLID